MADELTVTDSEVADVAPDGEAADAAGEAAGAAAPHGQRVDPEGERAKATEASTSDGRRTSLADRANLADLPLDQHAAIFGEVHRRLQAVLAEIDAAG